MAFDGARSGMFTTRIIWRVWGALRSKGPIVVVWASCSRLPEVSWKAMACVGTEEFLVRSTSERKKGGALSITLLGPTQEASSANGRVQGPYPRAMVNENDSERALKVMWLCS